MQPKTERIQVETVDYTIRGTITLPAISRMLDALNAHDRDFIALTDVAAASKSTGHVRRYGFMAISRQHIVTATTLGAGDEEPSDDVVAHATAATAADLGAAAATAAPDAAVQ